MSAAPATVKRLRETLAERFGFRSFRPGQLQAVRSAMQGRDVLAVMPTGSGKSLCFQLPVLLTLLARAGLVTSDQLKRYRKHAIVGVFIVAAILTPPDPISQIALALPTLALYEISIYAVKLAEKKRAEAAATAAAE